MYELPVLFQSILALYSKLTLETIHYSLLYSVIIFTHFICCKVTFGFIHITPQNKRISCSIHNKKYVSWGNIWELYCKKLHFQIVIFF
ncbi:hypothetical protein FKM82_011576 [Ascaphus truei]